MQTIDLAIIGSGAAGISAAIYAKRRGLNIKLYERNAEIGGQACNIVLIENFPGFASISGSNLCGNFDAQLRHLDVDVENGKEVKGINKSGKEFELEFADGARIKSRAVVLATGTEYAKLNVPGENELLGSGVSYCVVCDGAFFAGKKVAVVGAGNSGVSAAIYLSEICSEVHIIHNMGEISAEKIYLHRIEKAPNIKIILDSEVAEIAGNGNVEKIKIKNKKTNEFSEIPVDGVFIYAGLCPNAGLARHIGVQIDERGYIKIDEHCRTSLPGIFAAGDVCGGLRQFTTAVSRGAIAATSAYEYLRNLKEE